MNPSINTQQYVQFGDSPQLQQDSQFTPSQQTHQYQINDAINLAAPQRATIQSFPMPHAHSIADPTVTQTQNAYASNAFNTSSICDRSSTNIFPSNVYQNPLS